MTFTKRLYQLLRESAVRCSWRLRCKLQREITVCTRQGVFTTLPDDWAIGRALYEHGGYEFEESRNTIAFLKSHGFIPQNGAVMYDIGANIGVIGIGLVRAGDIDRVIAIEPDPENFSLLARNVSQNGLSQKIRCLQLAVSSVPGTLTMHLSSANRGDHRARCEPADMGRKTINVPSLTLNEIVATEEARAHHAQKPDVMWMDVQGFEGHVLVGADEVIGTGVPLAVEIWPNGLIEAGTPLDLFVDLAQKYWSDFWIESRGRFTRFPVSVLDRFIEFIGVDKEDVYWNVVFTRDGRTRTRAPTFTE